MNKNAMLLFMLLFQKRKLIISKTTYVDPWYYFHVEMPTDPGLVTDSTRRMHGSKVRPYSLPQSAVEHLPRTTLRQSATYYLINRGLSWCSTSN